MVTSNHSGAGTQTYGYNQANQRVFVRNGTTVTYYLYGMGGERLMEFQETCTGGACSGYQEKQRWIYFAGRKMFSKTGTTLKAITPNRLTSETKHFPYGETDGTPPSDTKDYFATYRRDGTGLDYAWNRYYSPTMGRFTTADPSQPGDPMVPQSWNYYGYTQDDPINFYDPTGLNLAHLVPLDGGGSGGHTFMAGIGSYSYWTSEYLQTFYGPVMFSSGSGGGGDKGSPVPPRSVLDAKEAAKALKDAFEKWKNCARVLSPVRRGSEVTLSSAIDSMTFVDGRLPGMMSMAGGTDTSTFAQFHAGHPTTFASVLLGPGNNISRTVALWADFFGNVAGGYPNPLINQQATLVHEYIHAILRVSSGVDSDHKPFFDRFARYGLNRSKNESVGDAIARWITNDCKGAEE